MYEPTPVEFSLICLICFGLCLVRVAWEAFHEFCLCEWYPSLKEDTAHEGHAHERPANVSPRISSNESRNNTKSQYANRIEPGTSSHDESSRNQRDNLTIMARAVLENVEARREACARVEARRAREALEILLPRASTSVARPVNIEEALRELEMSLPGASTRVANLSSLSTNNVTLQSTKRNNTGGSSHDESSVDKRNTKATCGSLKNTDSADITPVPSSLMIKPLVLVPETRHPALFKMPIIPIEKTFASKRKGVATGFSSWEVAFNGNIRRSRVLQLPDELLLEIMHATAIDDLYMLRQVSFTFWRLYQGREFDRFCRQYQQPSAGSEGFRRDKKTVTRARRNAFCEPCFQVLESGKHRNLLKTLRMQLLCSFCRRAHSKWQFPPAKRSSSGSARQCILSDGFICLCRHRLVSLKSIRNLCFHNDGMTRLEDSDSYTIEWCDDCHSEGFHSGWDGRRSELVPPSLHLSTGVGWKLQNRVRLSLKWTVPLLEISQDARVTMMDVQRSLEEVESKYGITTCPHLSFTDGQLLRMLDPRVCVCFGKDNRLGNQKDHGSKNTVSAQILTSCRRDAIGRLMPYGGQFESRSWNHHMLCNFCDTSYLLKRYGGHVFLHRNTDVDVYAGKTHRCSEEVAAIEPSSHTQGYDEETKHLTWCYEKGCRNGKHWDSPLM